MNSAKRFHRRKTAIPLGGLIAPWSPADHGIEKYCSGGARLVPLVVVTPQKQLMDAQNKEKMLLLQRIKDPQEAATGCAQVSNQRSSSSNCKETAIEVISQAPVPANATGLEKEGTPGKTPGIGSRPPGSC